MCTYSICINIENSVEDRGYPDTDYIGFCQDVEQESWDWINILDLWNVLLTMTKKNTSVCL